MAMDEQHLKDLIKRSFMEALSEKREFFTAIVEEVMEDMGLLRAMEEAENTDSVRMAEVRKVLRSADLVVSPINKENNETMAL